jgi:hypothetical protein
MRGESRRGEESESPYAVHLGPLRLLAQPLARTRRFSTYDALPAAGEARNGRSQGKRSQAGQEQNPGFLRE